MRILICCPYPLDKPGGVGDWTKQFKSELKKQGHDAFIVGPALNNNRKNPVDFKLGRMFTIRVEDNYIEMTITRNIKRAKKILGKTRPDVVNFLDIGASSFMEIAFVFASFELKAPDKKPLFVVTCVSQNDKWTWQAWTLVSLFKSIRLPKLWKNLIPTGMSPNVWNTVSKNVLGRIAISKSTAKAWGKIEPSKFKIIPNGVDFSDLSPTGPTMENWKENGKKIIMFTGRHDTKKGIKDLIKAYKIITKDKYVKETTRLVIVGRGHLTHKLKNEAKGLNVKFYNFLPRCDLVKAYRTADVFVSPSTGREAFGRTLAEALASGTPVVATKISGYNEWLAKRPFARLCKPGDAEDLSKNLLGILRLTDKERENLGKMGRKYVKDNFSIEKITKQTLDYFKEFLPRASS